MVSFFSFGNKFAANKATNKILVRNNLILTTNGAAIGSNAFWNGGLNFTSVGTNGIPSYYGTFDQTGLVWEWCDGNSTSFTYKVIRGGDIAGFGGYAKKYDSDKTRRYLKTVAGGDTNPPVFLTVTNRNRGKPQDQDWGGRIASLTNPLSLNNYVTIGDTGNSNDTTGYGAVSYSYKISKYLLTNTEYCSFLNSVAASDPNKLYSTQMNSERVGGISRSGSSGSYTYSIKTNMGNKPVYFLSWFSLARYCNWLHNNYGSTETGAYTLNNALTGIISKNSGALYYIPTESEWYKAAYYKGGSTSAGYWSFATQSNTIPTPVAASLIGDGTLKNVSIKPVSSTGTNVSITGINDSIYNVGLSINYAQVSSSGITKITPVTQNDPKLPVNFSLSNNLAKYNISTTSTRSGNIDLCFTLPSSTTLATFNKTKLFHTNSNKVTTNITITTGTNAPNYSTRTICGRSTGFSDFHLIPENDISSYPIPTNISGSGTNGKVALSWQMSDTTDVYDYNIKYSSDSGNTWGEFEHEASTGLSIDVEGLSNNTDYIFKVAAVGVSGGVADYATASPSITPVPGCPDTVSGVSATPGIGSATVSWNVPNNNGSTINRYNIQYSKNGGSSWNNSIDTFTTFPDDISSAQSLVVNNLDDGNYIFRVKASNSACDGGYSSSSNSVSVSTSPQSFTPARFCSATPGSGSYSVPNGASTMVAIVYGGGGGGYDTQDSCEAGGDGGNGGGSIKTYSVSYGNSVSYNIGTSGLGGYNGGPAPTAGGSSSITYNGVTISAGGGSAATSLAGQTYYIYNGTDGSGAGGDYNSTGWLGLNQYIPSGVFSFSFIPCDGYSLSAYRGTWSYNAGANGNGIGGPGGIILYFT
jgi:formylglycine-generating enzyme required for sulfatase activity